MRTWIAAAIDALLVIYTDTFFMEFRLGSLTWNPDLTKENHNTFINTANEIVEIVSRAVTSFYSIPFLYLWVFRIKPLRGSSITQLCPLARWWTMYLKVILLQNINLPIIPSYLFCSPSLPAVSFLVTLVYQGFWYFFIFFGTDWQSLFKHVHVQRQLCDWFQVGRFIDASFKIFHLHWTRGTCHTNYPCLSALNREGGYVSVKLQFDGGDVNNLNIIIDFLREGGGDLLTDTVYLKIGKIGNQSF